MSPISKGFLMVGMMVSLFLFLVCGSASAGGYGALPKEELKQYVSEIDLEKFGTPNSFFDADKMGDMTGWDPSKWENPKGDVIKIAVAWPHSGPGALNGDLAWACMTFVAYDINQRGGITVDGKKKKIALFKADTMSRPDQARTIMEKMILQEKIDAAIGTSGSNIQKIINAAAARHGIISVNVGALDEELQHGENFSRYSFMVADTTEAIGRGMAHYFGKVRQKEKKFYIICQDYSFGHGMGEGFKKGMEEYYPEGRIVGEDYHPLFATDFAPYITKVMASGADAIWTGDWLPDAGNLLKQLRAMRVNVPVANLFVDEPNSLSDIGVEGTRNLFNINHHDISGPAFKNDKMVKYHDAWHNNWKTWTTAPYNTPLFKHNGATIGLWTQGFYWYLNVVERAGTMDVEKIIETWEGDVYQFVSGRIVKMRACDHMAIQGFRVSEFVPPEEQKVSMNIEPYYWFDTCCYAGPAWDVPAHAVLPPKCEDRCAGFDGWGDPIK